MSRLDCSFLFAFASLASTIQGAWKPIVHSGRSRLVLADSGCGAVLRVSLSRLRSCTHDDEPLHLIPAIYLDGIACGSSAIGTFHQSSAAFDMLGSNII